MSEQAMKPHGLALLDYYNGDTSATVTIIREDGKKVELPAQVFFNDSPNFSKIEQIAIELCFGNILDIGAGSGRHSLALQNKGLNVFAIDIAPEAVDIMKKNGIKNVECIDIYEFKGHKFDTLLMLMHGIGMTENLAGLNRFLNHAHSLINPNGSLIFDSLDVRCTDNSDDLAYQERNKALNRYFGEIHMQFEYKGVKGEPCIWLHIDPETLINESLKAGWICKILYKEPWGDYLAKLIEK
ncbi:MAG: class I SAM-dependent methyltransferase [Bacillota bacterium]